MILKALQSIMVPLVIFSVKKTFPDLNPRRYLVLEYLLQAEKDAPVSHLQIAIQHRPA